jgi:hypothetical protein
MIWRCHHHLGEFFFKPASPRPLAFFRIGIALVLLWQAYLMHEGIFSFFGHAGLVQSQVANRINDPSLPGFTWVIEHCARIGLAEHAVLTLLGAAYLLSLLLLLAGISTRLSAFLVWLLHWCFLNTGYSGAYGADMYAHIFLFYLVMIPCGDAYSVDSLLRRAPSTASWQARLGLRVVQLHLCISYLASGIEKATGAQWWNGEVIWRALTTPNYSIGDFHWLAQMPFVAIACGLSVVIIETFYCVMMWQRRTRMIWIALTVALHGSIAVLLNLHIFGILMCVPTITLFALAADESAKKPPRRAGSLKTY